MHGNAEAKTGLDTFDSQTASADVDLMADRAKQASDFLKALSHETRLLILCILSDGEKSVKDLEALLELRQSTVSQQLARLRLDGLVETKRQGKTIYYSLANDDVRTVLGAVYDVFCSKAAKRRSPGPKSSGAKSSD